MDLVLDDVVTLPVRPGGFTVADIDALPESTGMRYELVDGLLIVSPSPRHRHQLLLADLERILEAACPPDLVVNPMGQDVRMGDRTNLVPDLLVERLVDIDLDDRVAAAPVLVVEVISPSSRRIDLSLKLEVYSVIGVPTYWVFHPAEDWARAYELNECHHQLVASAEGDELFRVERPFPVTFRPTDLLARFRGDG